MKKKYTYTHRRSDDEDVDDDDDDDDDNNNVMQGLKVKLFLVLCTTKGEEEKKKNSSSSFFWLLRIRQKKKKKKTERIEERKYRHMCIHAFLARCIQKHAYECTILQLSRGIYDTHILFLADAQGIGERKAKE